MGGNNSSQICIDSSDLNLMKRYKSSKFKSVKYGLNQLNQFNQINLDQQNILEIDSNEQQQNVQYKQIDEQNQNIQYNQIDEQNQNIQYNQIDQYDQNVNYNITIAQQLMKERKKNKYKYKHKYMTDIIDIGAPKKVKKKNGLCDAKYTMKLSKKGKPLDISPTLYEYNKFDEFIELITKTIKDTTGITVRNNSVLFFIIKPDTLIERIFISHISINDKYAILEFEKRCVKEELFLIYKIFIKKKLTLDIRTMIMTILFFL